MDSLKSKLGICILLCLIVFISRSDAKCTKESDKQYVCDLVSDIKEGEKQEDWEVVNIRSSSKQQTKNDSFENIPNVKKLILNGAVNKINKNSFNGLTKLKELQFFNNDLLYLKGNGFAHLPVEELLLYTSNIITLKVKCFDNLPKLKSIYIHKNPITNIPAGVFSNTSIEILFLNENDIRTIEEGAFYGMKKLRKLALERNHLKFFDSNLYVGNTSPNLSLLWLARNNLTKITKDLLAPFPKLKLLLMHINNIASVEQGTFDVPKDLRYIDLSNNKLEELSHRVFPWEGLEFLDILFLQNNRFIHLSTDVIAKLPRLSKIAIGGNPWLCPCYQELRTYLKKREITMLCDDEYLEGKRPVCVSPSVQTNKCNFESENVQNLYEFYLDAQMDYLKLPPLCKIYCGKGSCYSHDFDVLVY